MVLREFRKELDKLPPEADDWDVQILFCPEDLSLIVNEDISGISADDYVVLLVGESAV